MRAPTRDPHPFTAPRKTKPRKVAHQLGLGETVFRRPWRCIACAHELDGALHCDACGAFTCSRCDTMTTPNGGRDGICYGCLP